MEITNIMDVDIYALTYRSIRQKIGEKIREFRLSRNITQRDLAKMAGISLSSMSSIEKGDNVSVSTFISILRSVNGLEMLTPFVQPPEISPIAYAQLMEKQRSRKRAYTQVSVEDENKVAESEW